MVDLYETLGVEKTADKAEIRRAYRRAAKKAHPDTGGSPEEFERVTKAVTVLSDERLRKVYDEIGRAEDAPVDNEFTFALQLAMGSVDFVLSQIEARGLFLDDIDVIADAVRGLNEKLAQLDKAIKSIENNQAALKKAASKFRAKKGKVDRIGPMLLAKAGQFGANLDTANRERRGLLLAIEILNEHEFGSVKKTMKLSVRDIEIFQLST